MDMPETQTQSSQSKQRPHVSAKMRVWGAIIVLAVVGIVVYGLLTSTQGIELPATLGTLTLTDQLAGDAAARMIDHLHGKGVTPTENLIGFYSGEGGTATLYVSRYTNESEPAQVMERMAQRIRQGNPIFGDFKERTIAGKRVAECYGMDQVHYFFSHDVRLYWLGVDPPRAEETLEELLRLLAQ
jgi:hypothetical protein